MRIESSVVAISWIPSEAVTGMTKLPFGAGIAHYDAPPPDVVDDVEELGRNDGFRFANELRAWIEVDDAGRIVGWDHCGRGHIGSTAMQLGPKGVVFAGVAYPDIRPEPEALPGAVRFTQTAGGRTGVPAPRRVRRKPFFQLSAPLAWSTLALTIHSDGSSEFEVVGASPFPRHWVYDHSGLLAAKTGMINFDEWYRKAFGKHTPWGEAESPALVTVAETALERQLSGALMKGKKPKIGKIDKGETLVDQGQAGTDLFLLLDGVLAVEVDGEKLAEVGPGAILGERAILEGGLRTSTLRAITPCKVAVAPADRIDAASLARVAAGHRREETPVPSGRERDH